MEDEERKQYEEEIKELRDKLDEANYTITEMRDLGYEIYRK